MSRTGAGAAASVSVEADGKSAPRWSLVRPTWSAPDGRRDEQGNSDCGLWAVGTNRGQAGARHSRSEPLTEVRMEVQDMKKLLLVAVLLACGLQAGCVMPIYSSSPDRRARELIFVSEGLRHIPEIWERIWGLDMPDVATPYRTHGGVI